MHQAQWRTKILGLILKKANVIEEEDPNGKKSSEVCRDVQESFWDIVNYEEGSYIST